MKKRAVDDITTAFSGKIGEIIHTRQIDGRIFEKFARAPGIRLIIISSENKVLVTKEVRQETDGIDLRLPGGKVRDTLEAWRELKQSGDDIIKAASEAAVQEAREEAGLIIRNPEFITKAISGATVEWDLYFFLVRDYEEHAEGQQLEQGEDIEVAWLSTDEIKRAVSEGQMQEWRSAGVLLGIIIPMLDATD